MERGICEAMALWINAHKEKREEPVRGVDLMMFQWKGQRERDAKVEEMKALWERKINEKKSAHGIR